MDHAKLLDILTSLPVSHAILPRAVCFATSRPANHAICSFIDSSGYASEPIRMCLFIDYIIITFEDQTPRRDKLANSEEQEELSHNASFHQGMHCLLRQNQFSEERNTTHF